MDLTAWLAHRVVNQVHLLYDVVLHVTKRRISPDYSLSL